MILRSPTKNLRKDIPFGYSSLRRLKLGAGTRPENVSSALQYGVEN